MVEDPFIHFGFRNKDGIHRVPRARAGAGALKGTPAAAGQPRRGRGRADARTTARARPLPLAVPLAAHGGAARALARESGLISEGGAGEGEERVPAARWRAGHLASRTSVASQLCARTRALRKRGEARQHSGRWECAAAMAGWPGGPHSVDVSAKLVGALLSASASSGADAAPGGTDVTADDNAREQGTC